MSGKLNVFIPTYSTEAVHDLKRNIMITPREHGKEEESTSKDFKRTEDFNEFVIGKEIIVPDILKRRFISTPVVKETDEREVDPALITEEISKMMDALQKVKTPENNRFEISEIQFNLGISAKGTVGIFGFGGEAGLETAIQVTITRRS